MEMTLDEAVKIVKERYGLLKSYVAASGKMLYVVAEPQLRSMPGVKFPECGIAISAPEVIELASGAITIDGLVKRKNPELFQKLDADT